MAEFIVYSDPLGTKYLTTLVQPKNEMFAFKTITVYFKWTGEATIWPAPGNSHIKLTTNMGNENLFLQIRPNIVYPLKITQPIGDCEMYFDLGDCDMAVNDYKNLKVHK